MSTPATITVCSQVSLTGSLGAADRCAGSGLKNSQIAMNIMMSRPQSSRVLTGFDIARSRTAFAAPRRGANGTSARRKAVPA
ncbi:MAG: hypothetical protein QM820_28490 [Minicystis sp.]